MKSSQILFSTPTTFTPQSLKKNPSTPGVTTTPSHPKYQNSNINNTQIKMSEIYLTESYSNIKLTRKKILELLKL